MNPVSNKPFNSIPSPVLPCLINNFFPVQNAKNLLKRSIVLIVFSTLIHFSYSQTTDTNKSVSHFSGTASVTNNGISLIPTITLGKPALIFDLSMGKRFSFDPLLRFALAGKPWSFVFWWRYKLVNTGKFRFNIGMHPSLSFKTIPVISNGVSNDIIRTQRHLAGELYPYYLITNRISAGVYYMYIYGVETEDVRHTHFLTLNMTFSDIRLSDQFYMKFNPQVYLLKMDKNHGYYYTATLFLAKRKFPLSVSGLINKAFQTSVPNSSGLVWSLSLVYSFNQQFVKIQ